MAFALLVLAVLVYWMLPHNPDVAPGTAFIDVTQELGAPKWIIIKPETNTAILAYSFGNLILSRSLSVEVNSSGTIVAIQSHDFISSED